MYAIDYTYKDEPRTIYAKAENLNMTGSIKDRMAFHILKSAYETGSLKAGDVLAEATSGNTGIAISAIGRALGHPVTIYMPDWMSSERINLIKSLGATIHLVSKEDGGFLGSIAMTEDLAKGGSVFLPRQFSNQENVNAHYGSTGPEIWWQMRYQGLTPDAFVAGVGTGGTIMGVGKFLKERKTDIRLHPLEPSNSPTLSTGYKVGKHRIQGISDDNKKYLSTDLLKQEPVKNEFLSKDVSLMGFRAIKRVCHLCCDPVECATLDIMELSSEGAILPACPQRSCSH